MRWGLCFFLSSLFFVILVIDTAFAAPFNVTAVPEQVGTQLGTSSFVGGLLVSIFILMLVLVPTLIMTRGKAFTLYIVLALATLAPLVALGWFNIWVFIVIVLAISVGIAEKLTGFLGGIRK